MLFGLAGQKWKIFIIAFIFIGGIARFVSGFLEVWDKSSYPSSGISFKMITEIFRCKEIQACKNHCEFFFNYIFFAKGEPSPLNNGMAGASKVLPVTILADWLCFSFSFHENENVDKKFHFYRG